MSYSFSEEIPIVIINWNGIDDTLECMTSVLQLSYPHFKVYLVDNHSSDNSVSILKNEFAANPKVQLIFNQSNFGFTKGSNEVFELILNKPFPPPYIALLNNDTIVHTDWLSSLIKAAQENKASVVSSKMIDYYDRNRMDNAGHLMLNTGEILPIGHGLNPQLYNQPFENMGACAGACLYETKMLQEIGIFDEYFQTGYEDAEFGVRAVMAGHKCVYEPTAIVYHKMGSSIKKVFNYDYALSIQKKILYAYYKLIPTGNLLLNFPFFIGRYLGIIFVQLLFGRFLHAKLMLQAIKEIWLEDRSIIKKAKQDFRPYQTLSILSVSNKQTFFLVDHLKRFYHYFIQKKLSALDAYGKKELI